MQKIDTAIDSYVSSVKLTDNLERVINHQTTIIKWGSVPKKYKPHHLVIQSHSKLKEKFEKDYKHLFFKHLNSVIEENKIAAEIQKAKSHSLGLAVEKALIDSDLPTETIQKKYDQFLSNSNLQNHVPLPKLQEKLRKSKTTTPVREQQLTSSGNRKRHSTNSIAGPSNKRFAPEKTLKHIRKTVKSLKTTTRPTKRIIKTTNNRNDNNQNECTDHFLELGQQKNQTRL